MKFVAVIIVMLLSINYAKAEEPMKTLEIVTFKAVEGTTDEQMITAAKQVEPVIKQMDGNISRHFGKTPDGEWVDTVLWSNMDAAQAAAKQIMSIPEFAPFGALIDGPSVKMRHVEIHSSIE